MAQAMIQKQHNKTIKEINKQTHTQLNEEQIYLLGPNKILKLYFSNVYKENVLAFCLSSSKSFIINRQQWKLFRKLIPIIEDFFD
jgi:hypothetical protein